MPTRSRQMFLGLALTGCIAGGSVLAQEPVPPAPPATSETTAAPLDAVGICRISDCPPGVSEKERKEYNQGRYVAPNEGFVPPGRRPMQRVWVPYSRFFPAELTGQAAAPQQAAPMIYMPTDTTQLGYYYQHVPHWHSYGGMVPPVPRPVDWHIPQYTKVVKRVVRPHKPGETEMGEPQTLPGHGTPEPKAPVPPTQSDLEKSAATPDLIPVPR